MTDVKISQLPSATSSSGSDALVIVQSGTTKQITNTAMFTGTTLTAPVLGTPASGTLTNCTGLPISTGVSGLASNVATFLQTPTSANLAAVITNETGSGSAVFSISPQIFSQTNGFVNKTASFALANTEDWVICNGASANIVVTLPTAGSSTGRAVHFKNISGTYTVISSAANVVPLAGGSPTTAILAATAGEWATVVSNGSTWEIMAAG